MTERIATTPFGGGRFSAALFQAQETIRKKRKEIAGGGNITGKADKWQLLRALTEAKAGYGLSDRTIAVLEALMSFHPEKELDGTQDIIVFPSNAELSIRSRGMSAPTLRRHIAALVSSGLLQRRDSANGKRFSRKAADGTIEEAFGFNLAPAVLMAPEIFERAEAARAHAAAVKKVRGEITLHLRDVSKTIEAAHEDGIAAKDPDMWWGFSQRLKDLSGTVQRHAALEALGMRRDALVRLRAEVESAFLKGMDAADLDARDAAYETAEANHHQSTFKKISGNDARNERHIQNSNKENPFEYISEKDEERAGEQSQSDTWEMGVASWQQGPAGKQKSPSAEAVSLGELRQACPDFCDYALNGLNDWRDAREAAELARPMLGISKSAWSEALDVMGPAGAVVTIAYLIQRAGEIKSAGGYMRALAEKARSGKLKVKPMLASLMNASDA
ncbi:plasmid replication protein RepC [Roseibium denhamense]|uniref:Replication initiation protein RepC n=1 Tax=Roseibium denhamense TaxID=76305 RepID=A0ABY1PMT1_9HYPH|nr:plasmid replication protein RepC [Roseibium denhamense]SMP37425.1 replication initiation protein RepC [Roseibium denhamense]